MKRYTSPLLLLLTAMIWGFAFVAQKSGAGVPAMTMTAWRSGIATVFLFCTMPLFDKINRNGRAFFRKNGKCPVDITKREWLGGICCGTVFFFAATIQQFGLQQVDAGKGAFISALYVIFVPLFGLFFRRRPPVCIWICAPVAIAGFYLMCVTDSFTVAPADFIMLSSAVLYACHILVIDHFTPTCGCVRLSCVQFATAFVLGLVGSLIIYPVPTPDLFLDNLWEVLFLGIVSSGIAYTFQILGQKNTAPAVASVIMCLESVFGVIGSALILHEKMGTREAIGCAIVFVAVIAAQFDFPLKRDREKSADRERG